MTKAKKNILAILGCLGLGIILFFLFRAVFSGAVILPQVFHMGPLAFRYYGVILALAIVLAYWLAAFRAPQYGLNAAQLDRVLLVLVVSGFVGARLYHVLSEFGYYQHHFLQTFAVWQGGLSIFGALLGGVIGLWLWRSKLGHQPFFHLLDWLAPSLLLGQVIGRLGNWFNYELFGYPTSLPWKMLVPEQFRPLEFLTNAFFHPLFLYEALLSAIFLVILLKVKRLRFRPGSLFFSYLFLYNAGRFFLESLRPDSVFISVVRFNALVSAALALTGLGVLIYLQYASSPSSHN
jgi:phosphatidylglycerol---prolipoprotein diacylglyceryl transferase